MTEHSYDVEVLRSMFQKAKRKMEAARVDFDSGFYEDAVSRAYYGAFHALTAVLALHGLVYSSHTQALGSFNKKFVKTGIFKKQTTKILQRLFEDRQVGDYSWTI